MTFIDARLPQEVEIGAVRRKREALSNGEIDRQQARKDHQRRNDAEFPVNAAAIAFPVGPVVQHHGSRRPDHVRASPSLTSESPTDRPFTVIIASVRP